MRRIRRTREWDISPVAIYHCDTSQVYKYDLMSIFCQIFRFCATSVVRVVLKAQRIAVLGTSRQRTSHYLGSPNGREKPLPAGPIGSR
jgi:hypothetical protein